MFEAANSKICSNNAICSYTVSRETEALAKCRLLRKQKAGSIFAEALRQVFRPRDFQRFSFDIPSRRLRNLISWKRVKSPAMIWAFVSSYLGVIFKGSGIDRVMGRERSCFASDKQNPRQWNCFCGMFQLSPFYTYFNRLGIKVGNNRHYIAFKATIE